MSPQSFCQQALAERANVVMTKKSSDCPANQSECYRNRRNGMLHWVSTLYLHSPLRWLAVHYSTWEISKLEHLPDEFALHTGEFPNLLPFCNAAILSAKAPDQISPHKDQASPIHVPAQSILLARPLKFHRKSSTACVHSRITRRGCHCRQVTGLPVRPQDFRLRRDRVTPIHIFQLS